MDGIDLRTRYLPKDLNLSWSQRVSAGLSFLLVLLGGLEVWQILARDVVLPASVGAAGILMCLAGVYFLNRGFYQFLASRKGWLFPLFAGLLHVLYYIYSGISFALGAGLYVLRAALPKPPAPCRGADSGRSSALMAHSINGAGPDIPQERISADVIILGAGPAGLTAAYELSGKGVSCIVLERDSSVGGLAKTVDYKGHLFDLGGHRFYTKVALIERLWHDVLGADFLARPRLSRIYYRSRFFDYPLDPLNVVRGLGLFEILLCGLSFLRSRTFPQKPENNLARWVSNRFGRRLFKMFFKSYTEKVWGIPCTELSADWAAQRIRGLSFSALVRHALNGQKTPNGKTAIKTLIREFHYPRRGPGMMWSRMQEILEQRGSQVILNTPVEKILWKEGRITEVEAGGRRYIGKHFINSLAIRDFFKIMDPAPPEFVRRTALEFHYRDFITVGLIVRGTNLFPDNWIYVHEPAAQVGRIQNYSNWSREMSPDPDQTSSLGMEYFCFENDALWLATDEELLALARRELAFLGLVKPADILDGKVVRVPKAYPVYDDTYRESLEVVREFVATVPNLQLVGRNGMHRYNNQDHSMLTALMAARNILGANFDLWQMHGDTDYLEEGLALAAEDILELEEEASFSAAANGGNFRNERKPPPRNARPTGEIPLVQGKS